MTSEIVTLPGHLRVLFDKVYEGEPVAGTGWVVWQRVLQARIQDATFFKRLSSVQLACRSLRVEVDGAQSQLTQDSNPSSPSYGQWLPQVEVSA